MAERTDPDKTVVMKQPPALFEIPALKSGWKTSEFWVQLFTQIIALLVVLGVLSSSKADSITEVVASVGAAIASAVSGSVYSMGRTKLKAGE